MVLTDDRLFVIVDNKVVEMSALEFIYRFGTDFTNRTYVVDLEKGSIRRRGVEYPPDGELDDFFSDKEVYDFLCNYVMGCISDYDNSEHFFWTRESAEQFLAENGGDTCTQ